MPKSAAGSQKGKGSGSAAAPVLSAAEQRKAAKKEEERFWNSKWYSTRQNGAYVLKVLGDSTVELIGYIFQTRGGRNKDERYEWVRFTCSGGAVRLNLANCHRALVERTLLDTLATSSKFTRRLRSLLEQNPPPPSVIATSDFLAGLESKRKKKMPVEESRDTKKSNLTTASSSKARSNPSTTSKPKAPMDESDNSDDSELDDPFQSSAPADDDSDYSSPSSEEEIKPRKDKKDTKRKPEPVLVPDSPTNSLIQKKRKPPPRDDSPSPPPSPKEKKKKKGESHKHSSPGENKAKGDAQNKDHNKQRKPAIDSGDSDNEQKQKMRKRRRSDEERTKEFQQPGPVDERSKEGLSESAKQWMELQNKYYIGEFTFDPSKVEDAPDGRRIRGIDQNHVKEVQARILQNPKSQDANKIVYTLRTEWNRDKPVTFPAIYDHGVFPVGGSHSTAAYRNLHTMYPTCPFYLPKARLWNAVPDDVLFLLANEHNDETAFHKLRTYQEKVFLVREMWVTAGRPTSANDDETAGKKKKKEQPEWKVRSLHALGIAAPQPQHFKSSYEIFRVASAPEELWKIYAAMLTGNCVAYGRKKKRAHRVEGESDASDEEEDLNTETVTTTDKDGNNTTEIITARERLLRSGTAHGKPIESAAVFRHLIPLSLPEAIRIGTSFINGQITLKDIEAESARVRCLAKIREAFVDATECSTWNEACERYRYATQEQSLLGWYDAFMVSRETARNEKTRKVTIPPKFLEWCADVKSQQAQAQINRKDKCLIITREDARATLLNGDAVNLATLLCGETMSATLYFLDPPRPRFDGTRATGFRLEDYHRILNTIDCTNQRKSYLVIVICDLLQLAPLKERLETYHGSAKVHIRAATLHFQDYSTTDDVWGTPTLGVLYIWMGQMSDLENKRGRHYPESSLCLTTQSVPSHVMYTHPNGKPVEPSQLSMELCRTLISRHSRITETVVDLCSGSGTFAAAAFLMGRSVIAVESDPLKFNAIVCRMRCVAEIEEVVDDDIGSSSSPPPPRPSVKQEEPSEKTPAGATLELTQLSETTTHTRSGADSTPSHEPAPKSPALHPPSSSPPSQPASNGIPSEPSSSSSQQPPALEPLSQGGVPVAKEQPTSSQSLENPKGAESTSSATNGENHPTQLVDDEFDRNWMGLRCPPCASPLTQDQPKVKCISCSQSVHTTCAVAHPAFADAFLCSAVCGNVPGSSDGKNEKPPISASATPSKD